MPFLPRKVMLMKITNMVSTGLILTLLGSNIIIGESYILNQNKLEKKIHTQSKLIATKQKNNELLKRIIDVKSFENFELTKSYGNLNQQMDKVKMENTSLKTDNIKLKKQLKEREKVSKKRKFYVEATAYTATCQEGCTGITYTEVDVRNTIYHKGYRVIASDNSVLPLYSIVQVDTKNESFKAIVLDRGGGIDNFEIDLLVKNETDARNFGRQKVKITVLKEGNN